MFDKIVVSIVKNCIKNLTLENANNVKKHFLIQILSVDNIVKPNSNYDHLLKIKKEDFNDKPSFTEEEKKLLDIIFNV